MPQQLFEFPSPLPTVFRVLFLSVFLFNLEILSCAPSLLFLISYPPSRVLTSEHPGLISRKHAEIVRQGDKWVLRDLGSLNGVIVNGVRRLHAVLR